MRSPIDEANQRFFTDLLGLAKDVIDEIMVEQVKSIAMQKARVDD
ncbi:hypothetical protein B4113_2623 [Geobacillus sp. B4113_201601]|nr:hypothetical protein B4113_2623 [Geobacillus sp. B4113_201601]